VSNLTLYQSKLTIHSTKQIATVEQLTKIARETTAELHEFAVREVTTTLQQAAQLLPETMTEAQKSAYRLETYRYLATIQGIGYLACARIMGAVDEMLRLT
jgi:hypothetical protein